MSALFANPSVFEHDDLIGSLDGREAMGNREGGFVGGEGIETVLDQRLGLGIDVARRLVE